MIEFWRKYGYVEVYRDEKGRFKTWRKVEFFEIERRVTIPAFERREERFYRLTVALNFVVHHEYYSYKKQKCSMNKEELESLVDEFSEDVKDAVEDIVGYPPDEWWFPEEPNVEIEEISRMEYFEGVKENLEWLK